MSLYLSRLILDPRNREVRRDLGNCHDLHSRIMAAFPRVEGSSGTARADLGVLYRVEVHPRSGVQLLVQSRAEPDWSRLDQGYLLALPETRNPDCKRIDHLLERIQAGDVLRFRLVANPSRRVDKRKHTADPLAGKRVELRTEPEWLAWLARQGEERCGFRLLEVRATADTRQQEAFREQSRAAFGIEPAPRGPVPDVRSSDIGKVQGRKRHEGRSLTFGAVRFEGRLMVSDATAFRQAVEQGIGRGRSFGFGLLSIAPVRE